MLKGATERLLICCGGVLLGYSIATDFTALSIAGAMLAIAGRAIVVEKFREEHEVEPSD